MSGSNTAAAHAAGRIRHPQGASPGPEPAAQLPEQATHPLQLRRPALVEPAALGAMATAVVAPRPQGSGRPALDIILNELCRPGVALQRKHEGEHSLADYVEQEARDLTGEPFSKFMSSVYNRIYTHISRWVCIRGLRGRPGLLPHTDISCIFLGLPHDVSLHGRRAACGQRSGHRAADTLLSVLCPAATTRMSALEECCRWMSSLMSG